MSKPIPKKERLELLSKGKRWCHKCNSAQPIEMFSKGQKACKKCKKKQFYSFLSSNPEYMKKYRKQNSKKRAIYNRKWLEENREARRETRKLYRAKLRKTNPSWYMLEKIRSAIARFKSSETSLRTLEYVGVPSVEDFIAKMTEKTPNKSWLSEKWHIDHIWQLNWFSEALKNPSDSLLKAINRHENLRPLSPIDNCSRDRLDFTPLKKEDFVLYEPFLNEEIKSQIKDRLNPVKDSS